jgi:uncharacterized protein
METGRTKGLVLIGNELGGAHGAPSTRAAICEFLWGLDWLDIDVTGDWDALRWENVAKYDVVIQYTGGRRVACTPEQLAGITKYVERGGAYVPLHYTSANGNEEFLKLVGANFIGHPPFGPFTVKVSDASHPITAGLAPIELEDECYRSNLYDRDALHVIMTSHHPDKEAGIDGEPSAWTREIGKGRMFYSALGHDARVWPNPAVRELMARGIRWAARLEPVAVPSDGAAQ